MTPIKPLPSFVIRERELSPHKRQVVATTWPLYGLELASTPIVAHKIFGREAPLVLEIGFGSGEFLLNLAQKYPHHDFLGIEVYKTGIASLLAQLKNSPLPNIRLYHGDAATILPQAIPDHLLAKILILFPDPWPKKRHHKRRLLQPEFITLLHQKLKPQGILHLATDWENYHTHIMQTIEKNKQFTPLEATAAAPFLQDRITTKFEQRGKKLGHKIFDLVFSAN